MLNDLRAIIALWLMNKAMTIAPDDGLKVDIAKALTALHTLQRLRQGGVS